MFDIAPTELMLVALIALVVIGPKDLPRAMRFVGKWVGKARGMARHFRSGLDTMMREAELEELEKQWRKQNEEIMRQYPRVDDPAPLPDLSGGEDALRPASPPAPTAPAAPADGKSA
jgi:sec-independent protein translocase protein TatB